MTYLYKSRNLMQHLFDNFSTIMKRIFHSCGSCFLICNDPRTGRVKRIDMVHVNGFAVVTDIRFFIAKLLFSQAIVSRSFAIVQTW
jgi:hypothetical protein